ncbi:uncharacterized protein BDFB_002421 [Asbolus verrucosus]|uniref:Uncharacterized protein n=1 Tax=Asbolus verrucosus TaxID=1661398 RepID=A0A482VSZ9_ASBVE|nr:uncharacterized protein BDFB_002421 [Asbolus verrucosus]
MSGNRSKKNGKKNKFLNTPEVLQVQSVKLETNRASKKGKNNTKSEDNLRKCRKSNILKGESNEDESNEGVDELETSIMKKFKKLTLNNEGENNVPSTSLLKTSTEDTCADSKKVNNKTDEELPLMMKYCPELGDDTVDKYDEQYACTYKCYNKNTKSIKFTDEVNQWNLLRKSTTNNYETKKCEKII